MLLLANIIRTAAAVVVGIIVIAIVLVLLGASPSNDIVGWFNDAGSWLSSPFHGIFNFDSHRADVGVNWGIAAIVYGIVAALLVRLIASADFGSRWGRGATTF